MGYLVIDHRAGDGALAEWDTTSCPHCQAVLRVPRGRHRAGAFCLRCMKPVCNTAACASRCVPFFRTLETQLRRAAFARAAGLVEG